MNIRKVRAGEIARWAIGIVAVVCGMLSFKYTVIGGIFTLGAGLLLLPPIGKKLSPNKIEKSAVTSGASSSIPATKKCPYCSEEIMQDAKVCKHCGKKQPAKITATAAVVFVAIFAIFAFTLFHSSSSSPAPIASTNTVAIGDTGYLRSSADPILVPISKELLDRTTQLAVAKDTMGISEMVLSGEILPVKNGTQVRVIDAGFTSVEVRIMSGDYAGQSGWVPTEFVTK